MELLNYGTTIVRQDEECLEIYIKYHKQGKKVFVPRLESLNKFISKASRVAPFAYRKYYMQWVKALRSVKSRDKVDKKAYVTIITMRADFLDKINRYGGAKPIEDILVKKGWIKDDNDKWCDLSVMQGKCKRVEQHTYIRIVY